MATRSFSSFSNGNTTAEFRALWKELSDELKAAGLVQTADTGQINFATVNLPGLNTVAGYEIFRFDDALQATAPVFIKIEYCTGQHVNLPVFFTTVGSATNGAGVLSSSILNGATTGRLICCYNKSSTYGYQIQNVQFPSKICVLPGYLMIVWKIGSTNGTGDTRIYPLTAGFLLIARTVDQSNGANTGEGVTVYRYYGDGLTWVGHVAVTLNFTTGKIFPPTGWAENHNQVYFDVSSSMVNGTDVQLYRHTYTLPRTDYTRYIATYLGTEIPALSTFEATLVGSTPYTYLALGNAAFGTGTLRDSRYTNAVLFQ